MRIIAHRGNLNGPSSSENTPKQVDSCIEFGFDCEVDIWSINNNIFLGHDKGSTQINLDWLIERREKLWCHCKNLGALKFFESLKEVKFNYFWHENDKYTLNSQGTIWVYPGEIVPSGAVSVLPEKWAKDSRISELNQSFGICTDYSTQYAEQFL